MIGCLDQMILLERKIETSDGAGGTEFFWQPLPDNPRPWAKVEQKSNTESEVSGRRLAQTRAEFTIRLRRDLTPSDRIYWDGVYWNIRGIERRGQRVRYQVISAISGERA